MKVTNTWSGILLLLFVGTILPSAEPSGASQSGGLPPEPRWVEFPEEIIHHSFGVFNTVVGHDLLYQSFLLTIGSTKMSVLRRERETSTNPWIVFTDECSVDYHVTGFAAREGGDEVFLAGVTHDGVMRIERWRYILPDGHQAMRYPLNQPPAIGTPQAEYNPVVAPLGGTFIAFTQLPQPRKRSVYSTDVIVYTALAADPEGRFLLAYDYTHKRIVRFPLASLPSSPEVLFSSTTHPELAQVSSISIRDFPGEGRKALTRRNFASEPSSAEVYGVMHDANNDGNWESIQFFTDSQFASAPYGNWDAWKLFYDLE
jgi:hypothetical protein